MDQSFWLFVVTGFLAQLVDGALGMAYGVISTTLLLSLGLSPAAASASVHAAEIFTTGVSGVSHRVFGNVDRSLFQRLVLPGVVGAALGAYVLVSVPADVIRPLVAAYLLVMGLIILAMASRTQPKDREVTTKIRRLGLVGGFFDAIGGGGWGPIVTSTLIARGKSPRVAVGSVNLAEFFVTLSASFTFLVTIGLTYWRVTIALIVGGVSAAPLAAFAANRLPRRALLIMVGLAITILSLRVMLQVFV